MENYTVIKRLGDGAQGVTHLCVDRRTQERVVIKKLASGLRSTDEINAARKVKHPNIIPCLEIFTHEDFVCIVTRYAEGGDLESYFEKLMKEKKTVPLALINQWIGQLCRAVHTCHLSRVVHRDIKPGNIFMSKDGETLYLGDFGVAKLFSGSVDVATTFVGSPIWVSPEVLSGTPYSYMADVWSLGCVFYEMVTLRKPFNAPHFAALVMRICSGQFDPLPKATPQHLSDVIVGMLSIDVNERMLLTDVLNSSELFSEATTRKTEGSKQAGGGISSGEGRNVGGALANQRASPRSEPITTSGASGVDLKDWVKAKLRDVAAVESYLTKNKANDAILLQRVDQLMSALRPSGSVDLQSVPSGNLNPERAKRMLPSPMKPLTAASTDPPQGISTPVDGATDAPVAVVPSGQRWADVPPPAGPPLGKHAPVSNKAGRNVSPGRNAALGKVPGKHQIAMDGAPTPPPPPKPQRPASGQPQPVPSMPDLPTPPSKGEKREAQRQDIKAMIREQRARAAASGGDVAVEILLPVNLRNLPQNRV